MTVAMPSWRMLLRQAVCLAFDLARASAGNSIPARIAMMAMTTSNSMSVKPKSLVDFGERVFISILSFGQIQGECATSAAGFQDNTLVHHARHRFRFHRRPPTKLAVAVNRLLEPESRAVRPEIKRLDYFSCCSPESPSQR